MALNILIENKSIMTLAEAQAENRKLGPNEDIDGKTSIPSNQDKVFDTIVCMANQYYRDTNWKDIYTRSKTGQRQYSTYPNNTNGAYKAWDGMFYNTVATLGRWGQAEGLVFPYKT